MNSLRLQSRFLLFKFIKRFCSVSSTVDGQVPAIDPLTTSTYRDHIYCKRFKRSELVNYLFDNIVFNQDDIIVTNKPFGVQTRKKAANSENISLEQVSDDLAKKLNVDSLNIVIYPVGLTSGVTVFAASEKSKEILRKAICRGKGDEAFTYETLAITVGKPKESFVKTKVVVDSGLQGEKLKKKKKNQKYNVRWQHNVISSNECTSLLRVKSSKKNIHFILASKYFTPVLGDSFNGSRIKKVNDVYFFVKKEEKHKTQDIHSEVLSAIEVEQKAVSIIPAHLHFHAILLQLKKNQTFFVSVPPPEQFIWTCQKLNLVDEEVARNKAQFAIL